MSELPSPQLQELVERVRRELCGVPRRRRNRLVSELRDHLLCAIEDGREDGLSGEPARPRAAARAFGDPAVVGQAIRDAAGGSGRRRRPLVAALAACALVVAAPPSALHDRLAAPESLAAPPPHVPISTPTKRGCAAAFNAPINARWHAYARRIGARPASVGVYYFVHVLTGKAVIVLRDCGRPARAGRAAEGATASVFGAWRGVARTRFAAGRGVKPASRPADARVRADGTLLLVSRS